MGVELRALRGLLETVDLKAGFTPLLRAHNLGEMLGLKTAEPRRGWTTCS